MFNEDLGLLADYVGSDVDENEPSPVISTSPRKVRLCSRRPLWFLSSDADNLNSLDSLQCLCDYRYAREEFDECERICHRILSTIKEGSKEHSSQRHAAVKTLACVYERTGKP